MQFDESTVEGFQHPLKIVFRGFSFSWFAPHLRIEQLRASRPGWRHVVPKPYLLLPLGFICDVFCVNID